MDPGKITGDPDSLRLAHLSDPHLTSLNGVQWHELTNKRILGYLSWLIGRKRKHQTGVLNAMLEDLQVTRPDHIVVTGDLTHIGTGLECAAVKQWLGKLGLPDNVTVIPGNHDRYARADWQETVGQWISYLQDESHSDPERIFPALRCRGPVAMVGLSSAVPTAPFMATGRIGARQLQRLDALLADLADRGMFRVVMIHHGPLPGTNSYRRRLVDAHHLLSILKHRGAELVLHGHGHRNINGMIRTANGTIPVFGAASASVASGKTVKNSAYNLFRISRRPDRWELERCLRTYNPRTGSFDTEGPRRIS